MAGERKSMLLAWLVYDSGILNGMLWRCILQC